MEIDMYARTLIALMMTFGLLAPASAVELQPKSVAFLKEIKKSPDVTAVVNDEVGKYNLDDIASKRSEDGVRAFIATRNFVRKYRQNTRTPFPKDDLYVIYYLTDEEKQFIGAQLTKEQLQKKK
jgi:hypothetical protein